MDHKPHAVPLPSKALLPTRCSHVCVAWASPAVHVCLHGCSSLMCHAFVPQYNPLHQQNAIVHAAFMQALHVQCLGACCQSRYGAAAVVHLSQWVQRMLPKGPAGLSVGECRGRAIPRRHRAWWRALVLGTRIVFVGHGPWSGIRVLAIIGHPGHALPCVRPSHAMNPSRCSLVRFWLSSAVDIVGGGKHNRGPQQTGMHSDAAHVCQPLVHQATSDVTGSGLIQTRSCRWGRGRLLH